VPRPTAARSAPASSSCPSGRLLEGQLEEAVLYLVDLPVAGTVVATVAMMVVMVVVPTVVRAVPRVGDVGAGGENAHHEN
jgi:hypothetical protein